MVHGHFFAKVSEFVTDDGRWAFPRVSKNFEMAPSRVRPVKWRHL
jgi:hypothetical protein